MKPTRQFQEGATMQVAVLVRDMDAAMKRHWDVFKIGPWDIYTFDESKVQNYTYRGNPATTHALSRLPGVAILSSSSCNP